MLEDEEEGVCFTDEGTDLNVKEGDNWLKSAYFHLKEVFSIEDTTEVKIIKKDLLTVYLLKSGLRSIFHCENIFVNKLQPVEST